MVLSKVHDINQKELDKLQAQIDSLEEDLKKKETQIDHFLEQLNHVKPVISEF